MARPKTLFFDIETAPILGYTWEMFDTNVIAVERPTYMLAWAAKWNDSKAVIARTLPDYPIYAKNPTSDSALVRELHGLLDQADIVVAHNADFDTKKTHARFLANGIGPPAPYKTFCTLKAAKKHFKFDSNKLDSLGGYLGVGRKVQHTGIHLWRGCMKGDPKSWEIMRRYNKQDVVLLWRVWDKMRGYATNYPDANMWSGQSLCPTCQSSHIQQRGYSVSKAGRKQRFQCMDCSTWFSLGKTIKGAA